METKPSTLASLKRLLAAATLGERVTRIEPQAVFIGSEEILTVEDSDTGIRTYGHVASFLDDSVQAEADAACAVALHNAAASLIADAERCVILERALRRIANGPIIDGVIVTEHDATALMETWMDAARAALADSQGKVKP